MTDVREGVIETTDEQVWLLFGPELLRYARVLVGRADAHDVVVDGFLRAQRVGWDRIANVRAYLYRTVTNEARNAARSEARRRRRELTLQPVAVTESDGVSIEVRLAVAQLSVRQRAVVYLAYWRDLPEAEIGELLRMSRSSVRRHHERAQGHLRKALR